MCSNTSTDVIIANDSDLNGISCIGVENTVPFANKSDAYSFNGKLAASIPLASTPLCLNFLTITAVPHPASPERYALSLGDALIKEEALFALLNRLLHRLIKVIVVEQFAGDGDVIVGVLAISSGSSSTSSIATVWRPRMNAVGKVTTGQSSEKDCMELLPPFQSIVSMV